MSNRAREHVIPQWMLAHLGAAQEEITFAHLSHLDEDGNETINVRSTRTFTLGNFLCGRVCRGCNGGWMARLEAKVKPNLIRLMEDDLDLEEFGPLDREALARWALKTALAYNAAANYTYRMPQDHARYLARNTRGLPKNVVVCMGFNPHHVPHYICHLPYWQVLGLSEDDKGVMEQAMAVSYKIGMQFGRFMLVVAWWGSPRDYLYVLQQGVQISVWPLSGPILYQVPQEPEKELDSRAHFYRWMFQLGVSHRRYQDGERMDADFETIKFRYD